jgi:peroxiredoxin Q/BCP
LHLPATSGHPRIAEAIAADRAGGGRPRGFVRSPGDSLGSLSPTVRSLEDSLGSLSPTVRSLEDSLGSHSIAGMALSPGDDAPDFTLFDQHDESTSLKSLRKRKVLVYFYPKADTPGCTKQACGLNDVLGDIGDTAVLGISPDKPSKQLKFAEKYGLGFPLLSDPDHAVAEAFGVWKEKSMYGRKYMGIERSAFLIDEKGKIAEAWYRISPADTPKNLLAALA